MRCTAVVQLSSKHLAEEVMRAMTLFEYDLTAAPVLIKNEMSEHVARYFGFNKKFTH
jgi:hypothetical protein